ncbi:low molecular weight protein-tyrosine-phosphatase [Roseivirga sp. BDSF3-8]|uniref:low molecular weight protein-tyrosine-phosphatase n=1 Tax=Roseivirga sp. BDSF3-8 TaxID=3241598 RepID=UPI003531CB0B
MINVLFVCLGNICRSPLAEGVFKKLVEDEGLADRFTIDSAGTSGYHDGDPADPRSIACGREYDIIVDSISRQLEPKDFTEFDYLVAMDESNRQNILKAAGNTIKGFKLVMMRDFDDEIPAGGSKDVPDPYWSGQDGFTKVYEMILRSGRNFLEHLKKEHNLT